MTTKEAERLEALRQFGILDSGPEVEYTAVAQLASQICSAPYAVISFVDSQRVWLKANVGISGVEIPREDAFCSHVISHGGLFVVNDATPDARFAGNPLVTGPPGVRFYAGIPLTTREGHALGALAVMDDVPRRLAENAAEALRELGVLLMSQLELRRTAAALRDTEEFSTRLVACSRDCIKVLDLEGRLLFINDGGVAALGICDRESVLHRPWPDFWQGADRESAQDAVHAACNGETRQFSGYFPIVSTGEPHWWDVIVAPILNASGRPERLLAVSRDITRRVRNEIALRETSQFTDQIIAGAEQGIMVCDAELRYRLFNPFMERLTGKKSDEVVGRYIFDVFPGLRLSGLEQLLRRALAGEVVRAEDFRVPGHSATGADVWESCTYAPHRDAEGNIIGVIALIHDVTERHIVEETFRSIVVGTVSATGSEFFPSLVRHLAIAMNARWAFLAACDDQKHANTVAFWKEGELLPNFSYDVRGTPCERVALGENCYYQDLQAAFPDNEYLRASGAGSYLGIPMTDVDGRVLGHLVVVGPHPASYNQRQIDIVRIFAARAAAELKRQLAERELESALEQVRDLQSRLEAENVYLQEEIQAEHNFEEIVGRSPAILRVLQDVETIAPTDSTVLVMGETGCGKELIARALHSRSKRKHRPLVKLNCGAIPTGLVESELFGHRKGAFTGALENRTGRFELADGGTLFLDEVSELPLDVQVKLLRVLQEHEFEPLGTSRTIRVNVRIIAASNRDLEKAVKEGRFRADLYFRLNVLPVVLPPLRQRRSDIPLLTSFFVERFSRQLGKHFDGVAQQSMEMLSRYDWPGNIRELQNVIERAVVLSRGPILRLNGILLDSPDQPQPPACATGEPAGESLEKVERRHIHEILHRTGWVIEGARGAAQILGLHPNTLRSRMKKLGIARTHEAVV
ncbi:MAG TPA: sigma 54-interacting transcriptional regulator [Bryobacteraceae bacterium]